MPYIEKQSRYAKLKAKERQRQHNLEWTKYYQDKIYMQNKIYYKKTHPLCEDCLSNDIVTPAVHLHHIVPFSTGLTDEQKLNLLRNTDNFVCLCEKCHKKRHEEMGNGFYLFKRNKTTI